jgi:hypothetical protein
MTIHSSSMLLAIVALAGLVPSLITGKEPPAQPFAQAELFLELNDTDGDLGLHAAIDGGTWTSLEIEGPREMQLLSVVSAGRLRSQGLTQLAFESQEPDFDELDPATFFRRFPEGFYEIEADAQGGGTFESVVRLSHVLAAPPLVSVNGFPLVPCDDPTLPDVVAPVTIDWDPVVKHHPELGRSGTVTISRYQVFVERGTTMIALDLPPTVTKFEVPASLTSVSGTWKFEVIARTTANNNTAVEGCFRLP